MVAEIVSTLLLNHTCLALILRTSIQKRAYPFFGIWSFSIFEWMRSFNQQARSWSKLVVGWWSNLVTCACDSDQIRSVSLVEVIGRVFMTIQSSHMVINNHGFLVPFEHYTYTTDVHNIMVLAQLVN